MVVYTFRMFSCRRHAPELTQAQMSLASRSFQRTLISWLPTFSATRDCVCSVSRAETVADLAPVAAG
eukprot:4026807-Amphidinium_carterae.1